MHEFHLRFLQELLYECLLGFFRNPFQNCFRNFLQNSKNSFIFRSFSWIFGIADFFKDISSEVHAGNPSDISSRILQRILSRNSPGISPRFFRTSCKYSSRNLLWYSKIPQEITEEDYLLQFLDHNSFCKFSNTFF